MSIHEFNMLPLLLKRKDVLTLSGWSRRTLESLVASGELTPAMHSQRQRQRFFKRESLRRWLL